MAEEEKSSGGGGGGIIGVAILLIALALIFPGFADFVFRTIPATVSVVTDDMTEFADSITKTQFSVGSDGNSVETGTVQPQEVAYTQSISDIVGADGSQTNTPNVEYTYYPQSETGVESPIEIPDVSDGVASSASPLAPFAIFASLLLVVFILYSFIRVIQIRSAERKRFDDVVRPVASGDKTRTQLRWEKIIEQSNSDNEADWRMAVLEADIMLDELLDVQGYKGETMGEKMKQVERADFNTINMAWDAHKVRNNIAHAGSEHMLNAREIKRVIGLYQSVFQEFGFV